MYKTPVHLVMVDNNEAECTTVRSLLQAACPDIFVVTWAANYEQGLDAMLGAACDVCLIGALSGERSGLDLLAEATVKASHIPVILMTSDGGPDRNAYLTAAKAGAVDYLVKGELTAALLERSIRYAVERRRAQNAIRDASQSQALNQAKTAFLASMSHEMRTPMNSILGMADTLWESPLSREQMNYVETLRRHGAGLLNLINDILDLSNIESGTLQLQHVPFDLEEVVDQVIDFAAVKARKKGLVLLSHFEAGIPTSLWGDPARLKQILTNLVGNAIKFTDSGEVLLTVKNGVSGKPFEIDFAIADTGIGIPADKMEVIFHKFTQADTSSTRAHGGAGIGLSICRGLVEAMGGTLTATSLPDRGSTLQFSVAFDPAPKDGTAAAAPEESVPLRVLIVDDSPDNRWLIQVYLKGKKYQLTMEEDGQAAVKRFETQEFDLILMDIQMPVMDGLTATRTIRGIERARESAPVPILAVTANGSLQDMEKSADAGCNAHLVKPLSKLELNNAIDEYVRKKKSADSAQPEFGERIRIEVPPGLAEIVPPYLTRRRKEVPEMYDLLAKSDFDSLARLGHNLKGTGGGYGFLELTSLGAWLEQSAKQNDAEVLRKRITDLHAYLDRVQLV
jgi:signal transduction histidine kinase/AmiR/NasT family two-component response regulator/HPt (histidine-containing phosphotransfer) domain-containing protein